MSKSTGNKDVLTEAADEIHRLRADRDAWRKHLLRCYAVATGDPDEPLVDVTAEPTGNAVVESIWRIHMARDSAVAQNEKSIAQALENARGRKNALDRVVELGRECNDLAKKLDEFQRRTRVALGALGVADCDDPLAALEEFSAGEHKRDLERTEEHNAAIALAMRTGVSRG